MFPKLRQAAFTKSISDLISDKTKKKFTFLLLCLACLIMTVYPSSATEKWIQPTFQKEWKIENATSVQIISMTANKNGLFVLIAMPGGTLGLDRLRYHVQRYDLNGNYIGEWPKSEKMVIPDSVKTKTKPILAWVYNPAKEEGYYINSGTQFIAPKKILSDTSGNIYVIDYRGNKVEEFSADGKIINLWRILDEDSGIFDEAETNRGAVISEGKLYSICTLSAVEELVNISIFNINGELLVKKELSFFKVATAWPLTAYRQATIIPFLKEAGYVRDMAVDESGNMYFLASARTLIKLDKHFKQVMSFEPVLSEGFDTRVKVLNPSTGKYEKYYYRYYSKLSFPSLFNSQKGSGLGWHAFLYDLNGVYFSPQNQLYITFTGQKPFGDMIAIIYDSHGKMLGYWKDSAKSHSDWYAKLSDNDKLGVSETNLAIAFYGRNIFVGKTIPYYDRARTVNPNHSFIEKFKYEGE